MAPTIYRIWSLRVVIYPKDHNPPHVHVIGPGAEAKFEMINWTCIESYGFTEKSLKRIRIYLISRKDSLWEAWNDYKK